MDRQRQREIACKGGKAAHKKGAHKFTVEEAKAAGRKGGERVSADRNHMRRRPPGRDAFAGRRAAESLHEGGDGDSTPGVSDAPSFESSVEAREPART